MNPTRAPADIAHYLPTAGEAVHAARRTASRYLIEAAVSDSNPTRDSGVLQHSWLPPSAPGAFAPPRPRSMSPGHPINGGHDDIS